MFNLEFFQSIQTCCFSSWAEFLRAEGAQGPGIYLGTSLGTGKDTWTLGSSLNAGYSPWTSGQLRKALGPWPGWNQLEKAGEGWTRLLGLVRPGNTLWHPQNTLVHSLTGNLLAIPWKCYFWLLLLCTFFDTFFVKCHVLQLMSSMTVLAV